MMEKEDLIQNKSKNKSDDLPSDSKLKHITQDGAGSIATEEKPGLLLLLYTSFLKLPHKIV